MPATARSWRITEAYRRRISNDRKALQVRAEQSWPIDGEISTTDWVARMVALVEVKQSQAVRRASAYLAAYVASETGSRTARMTLDPAKYVGLSRDGRPLAESFRSPLIGVLYQIKQGDDVTEALKLGKERAKRTVGVDYDNAHRLALLDAIAADPNTEGWQRAVAGTCGACAAAADGTVDGSLHFEVHPNCQCISEPVVIAAAITAAAAISGREPPSRDAFRRPTGQELFDAKTEAEQNEMLGPETAQLVRDGIVTISDLYSKAELDDAPDFITQRPLNELT